MNLLTRFCVVVCALIVQTNGQCTSGSEEIACAEELGIGRHEINLLLIEPPTLKNDFTTCVWKKLEFLSSSGNVDFEKMKNLPGMYWVVGRVCNDDLSYGPNYYPNLFNSAIENCKEKLAPDGSLHDHSVEDIRKCIEDSVKADSSR